MIIANEQDRKRVLFLAFHFPPSRTSGIYRHLGITKYLKLHNWSPTILTALADSNALIDQSLLEHFPRDIKIVRTKFFAVNRWEGKLKLFSRRFSKQDQAIAAVQGNGSPQTGAT